MFSYDFSSATDIFPLSFQETLVERLNNKTVRFSWVVSGLGCNVFLAPTSQKGSPFFVPLSLLFYISFLRKARPMYGGPIPFLNSLTRGYLLFVDWTPSVFSRSLELSYRRNSFFAEIEL